MSSNPSITLIVATLDSASYLPRLLESLRRQTDRQFACRIMDGGSTDGTWDIIQSHGDVITHATCEPDDGLYDALNKGIRGASSLFYLVLGADDLLYPDAVEKFKQAAVASHADVVVAGVKAGTVVRRGFRRDRAWLGHAAMITSHSVGMLIRKDLHERFGYYSLRYPILADGFFIKRIANASSVRICAADFIAGEFSTGGISNRNMVRVLCESWQVQLDTGERPLLQYLLFQLRLLKNLPRILRRVP